MSQSGVRHKSPGLEWIIVELFPVVLLYHAIPVINIITVIYTIKYDIYIESVSLAQRQKLCDCCDDADLWRFARALARRDCVI